MSDVTHILSQIDAGDPQAAEQLLPLVYDELRKLAAASCVVRPLGKVADYEPRLRAPVAGHAGATQHPARPTARLQWHEALPAGMSARSFPPARARFICFRSSP
jgi:hypothetical protein